MRALALLTASLFAAAIFAGCAGTGAKVDPTPATSPTGTTPGTMPAEVKTLPPLKVNVTGKTPTGTAWIVPGSPIDLSAVLPADAAGPLSILWAYGAVPGTAAIPQPTTPDTGAKSPTDYLQPGDAKGIRFTIPGSWQMHCHPHPWMRSNVTVVDGYSGPSQVDVYIVDGATQGEFRFVPENVVVGPSTVVVYHNAGTQPHTATSLIGAQDAPVKSLPLKASTGQVTLDAKAIGWQRIRLFVWDSAGRMGRSYFDVYQAQLPTFTPKEIAIDFKAAGTPVAAAPAQAQPPIINNFVTSYNGTMYVNYTLTDAGAAQGVSLVDVHAKAQGDSQDIMTSTKKSADKMSARATTPTGGGTFTVEIDPEQGAGVTGTLKIEMVYDLIPPAPVGYVDPESIPHKH